MFPIFFLFAVGIVVVFLVVFFSKGSMMRWIFYEGSVY